MTVKERLEKAAEILQKAQTEAAPYLEGLDDYLAAAAAAHRLGLTEESSSDDIINVFANATPDELPYFKIIPQTLEAGAPKAIKDAGEQLISTFKAIGTTIGSVIGIIAGLK